MQPWFLRGEVCTIGVPCIFVDSQSSWQELISQMKCSPYYGQRRPSMQHGAKLQCVSDLLLLGKATIDEARSLLYWLQAEAGYGKMGICGLSMGMYFSH